MERPAKRGYPFRRIGQHLTPSDPVGGLAGKTIELLGYYPAAILIRISNRNTTSLLCVRYRISTNVRNSRRSGALAVEFLVRSHIFC
jgi:hypothetical protein